MKKLTLAAAALALAFPVAAHAQDPAADFVATSEATEALAIRYFDRYTALDWDAVEDMLHDEASFVDPTAKLIFQGVEQHGKDAVMGLFRLYDQSVVSMKFTRHRTIASGDTAVLEGELEWVARIGPETTVETVMPFTSVITVADGKVIGHRDYGDYRPFLANAAKARSEGGAGQ